MSVLIGKVCFTIVDYGLNFEVSYSAEQQNSSNSRPPSDINQLPIMVSRVHVGTSRRQDFSKLDSLRHTFNSFEPSFKSGVVPRKGI